MVLIFEILLLGPLLTAAAVELTHRYPRSRYAWAFCLSSFAAWALGYAVDLCAAAADGRLEWDDGGFAIFNWLIVGLFVQGLGFFVSRNKWPLAAIRRRLGGLFDFELRGAALSSDGRVRASSLRRAAGAHAHAGILRPEPPPFSRLALCAMPGLTTKSAGLAQW